MQLLEKCTSNATVSRMSKAKNKNWNESKSSSPQIRKGWALENPELLELPELPRTTTM